MASDRPTGAPRTPQELLWPLPPMCGALGVALTWYLPEPDAGREAARDMAGRQLAIWGLSAGALARTVDLVLDELIASAVRHGAGPLFLEIGTNGDGVAVAVRAAGPEEWADPAGAGARGLEVADALADELTLRPVPGGNGHAYVAVFTVKAGRGGPGEAVEPSSLPAPAASRSVRAEGHGAPTARRRSTGMRSGAAPRTGLRFSPHDSAGPLSLPLRPRLRRRRAHVLTRTDGWPCQGIGVNATLGGPRGPTRRRSGASRTVERGRLRSQAGS